MTDQDQQKPYRIVTTPPLVLVVGMTRPVWSGIEEYLDASGKRWLDESGRDRSDGQEQSGDPELIAELAGRMCYRSEFNPKQRTTGEYLAEQVIAKRHGSVLEHITFNCAVHDLPRSTQLELVRHGDGTAFSFESTRYTDGDMRFVVPPALRETPSELASFEEEVAFLYEWYQKRLNRLASNTQPGGDLTRKQAKEAARSMLPNSQGSDGMVTVNGRSWRWIVHTRSDPAADASIREFAVALYVAVAPYLDGLIQDATRTTDDHRSFLYPKA